MNTLKIVLLLAFLAVGVLVYIEAVELGEAMKQQQQMDSLYYIK